MLKISVWAYFIFGLLSGSLLADVEYKSISLGIFPYVSTGRLIAHNVNVLDHLNHHFNGSLSFVTAKNMDVFFEKVKTLQYDLIFTPPHLALFAQTKLGYRPMVMTTHHIRGVFLVLQDSAYYSLADLENKSISMVPEKALLHQIALEQLKNNGLVDGENLHINSVKTNNNAIYNLLIQDSQAALTGVRLWENLPDEKKKKLRQIAVTEPAAGFVLLARPGLQDDLFNKLQQTFLSFNAIAVNEPYIFNGFKRFDQDAMKSMETFSRAFE